MKQSSYSKDIILILAASFFYLSSPMLVTPLIVGFSKSLGASAALAGMIGGAMNLCALFCRPLVGNLTDRISKYTLSFVGSLLMAAACAGYVFAPNAAIIILARIVNGVGYACCSVCMSTWMSNLLPRDKIGSGMGLYGTMNALGMAIAPAVGVTIYQVLGYRVAFCLALASTLITIVIIQFVQNKGRPEPASSVSESRPKLEIVDRNVLPIAIIIMLFAIPYCATQSFLVSYTEVRHLAISVSLFFPLYAVVLLVLRLSLKDLFDRLPFRTFLFACSFSALAAIALLAVMRNNLIMFLAALFMAGGYGIMCSVCQSNAILLAGKGKRGLANSTYYIGLDLGMTLGPILGGILFGKVAISLFYPVLLLIVPATLLFYLGTRRYAKI